MIAALLLGSAAAHAEDCVLDKQYLARAGELAKARGPQSVEAIKGSVGACPSYESYESLGILLGHSKNRRDWLGAAQAFVSADALAPTAKERAETLYQYASLVNDDLDPQNAYPMIKKAQALDPARKDIAKLAADIEKEVRIPKKQQLERSFGLSVYKPLNSSIKSGGGAVTGAGHRQINVPINFDFNSVSLSDKTKENLPMLAGALARAATVGQQRFVFVGHSDASGDEHYNAELSRRRADAMREAVLQLQPSLSGHIDVEGRGSADPIDPGTGVSANRANRRLQVLQK
jgi:outer membrane protein OmpA-like peptidoglycan-associated protein